MVEYTAKVNKIGQIIFKNDDFQKYRNWLNLRNIGFGIEGKYEKNFDSFWSIFFIEDLSLRQVMQRFDFVRETTKIGPLYSWFKWLEEKFICYVFLFKDISLKDLAFESSIDISDCAYILRNYFVANLSSESAYFNDVFHVGNLTSENVELKYSDLKVVSDPINLRNFEQNEDEIMGSLEVTLYKEWDSLISIMKKELYHDDFDFKSIKRAANVKKQFLFLREVALFLILGFLSIGSVIFINNWYEKYLENKLSYFKADFLWLNTNLIFQSKKQDRKVELEHPEKPPGEILIETTDENLFAERESVGTESEVILSSLDVLPKDFDLVESEQSDYEEYIKGQFRDSDSGKREVFRVLIKSDTPVALINELDVILKEFGATQADNVRPGTFVPGGVYYNLHVPRVGLKEFLMTVSQFNESMVYVSRSRWGVNPPGKNKVFIWIKNI